MFSKIFKEKELTDKEKLDREYSLRIKKEMRKLKKDPFNFDKYFFNTMDIMQEMVDVGLMTEKQQKRHIEKFNKTANLINKKNDINFFDFLKKKDTKKEEGDAKK